MKFKTVFRYDHLQRKLRLFRLLWRRGTPGRPPGYSAKLSAALVPKLFGWNREYFGWRLTLFGVQFHHLKSYGGTIV